MKKYRFLIILIILPITLVLDLILYGILNTCPGCSTFSSFLKTSGALSFPFMIELTEWAHTFIKNSRLGKHIVK